RRQDLGAGRRAHHRRRPAGPGARRSACSGSLSGGSALMNALAHDTGMVAATTEELPFFSVRNIHAYYGESYIVQGVSLDIRYGEILALLGRNGAGKSSTLRTIARLD